MWLFSSKILSPGCGDENKKKVEHETGVPTHVFKAMLSELYKFRAGEYVRVHERGGGPLRRGGGGGGVRIDCNNNPSYSFGCFFLILSFVGAVVRVPGTTHKRVV